jgi:RNA polymerase sigma factor (sigma-70 family)
MVMRDLTTATVLSLPGRACALWGPLEASTLTHAGRRGLLARRTPLLRLLDDGRLVGLVREGSDSAFEVIVSRYQARLLGFCRQMLGSTEDAEDVLQEVFVNAYRALLADRKEIKLRPWLYRIARNRCLNHLRRPTADGQDSMDGHAISEAASTHERVQNREEFRQLLSDVSKLPETQRTALLLREMDALAYEEIAQAMETTVPSVKSLLVRARIGLAEASQARLLTCGEVRLELAEAAEGLGRASGPVRKHVRDCEQCQSFRDQLRSNERVLSALFPVGLLAVMKSTLLAKLGLGGGSARRAGAAGAGAGGGVLGGAGATGAAGAAGGIGGAGLGGAGIVGAAVGTKAAAGVVTAALLTAGAVEVNKVTSDPAPSPPAHEKVVAATPQVTGGIQAPVTSARLADHAGTKAEPVDTATAPATTTETATTPTTDPVATTQTTAVPPPTTTATTTPTTTTTPPVQGSITASIHGTGTATAPAPAPAPVPEQEQVSSGVWTGSAVCEAAECSP